MILSDSPFEYTFAVSQVVTPPVPRRLEQRQCLWVRVVNPIMSDGEQTVIHLVFVDDPCLRK